MENSNHAVRAVHAVYLSEFRKLAYRFYQSTDHHAGLCEMHSHRRIAPLGSSLAAKLRSGCTIQSLSQAAEECVCNSIDAGARHIYVQLIPGALSLVVTDDGHGIGDLSIPSVAQPHATSKQTTEGQLGSGLRTLGYRGTALASMALAGRLDITSKAAGAFETHTKSLRCGKLVFQGLATEQWRTQGTVVHLSDFLCDQPVRLRQLTTARLVDWILAGPANHFHTNYKHTYTPNTTIALP